MDIQLMLRDMAKRASRYCTDLGDKVDRDITKVVRGGSAFVCCGTLHPEGIAVAVKTFHFGHKSDVRVSCDKGFRMYHDLLDRVFY